MLVKNLAGHHQGCFDLAAISPGKEAQKATSSMSPPLNCSQ